MGSLHREVETKYEPAPDATLPKLDAVPGVAKVMRPVKHELEAVYYDTSDLDLAVSRITLRRRTGGSDDGWHVKLPAGDGQRDEIQEPLGRATKTVPKHLRDALRIHTHDKPLKAVTTIRTVRRVHRLADAEGSILAEVCDDEVTATNSGARGEPLVWREWEVELVDGDTELLDAVDSLLRGAHAAPAEGPSKLARALGDRLPPRPDGLPTPTRRGPASAVALARLSEQVEQMRRRDPQVRRDLPDSVHQMRVAMRRLRSALATFRPLLDADVTEPLREELKWVGGVLGEARDAEVTHDRLAATLTQQPDDAVQGSAARRIEEHLSGRYSEAHDRAIEAMDSERYLTLVRALEQLVDDPPWTGRAHEQARDVLPRRMRNEWKRVRDRMRAADDAPTQEEQDLRLHEVRKAAKRARYAAEALEPVYGRDAKRFAKAMKQVQSVLGDHQDSVVTQPLLHDLGVHAHEEGENAFTFGYLQALEHVRAAETRAQYDDIRARASRRKLRTWMS